MSTVTEITAATHLDVFARITRLDTPPASLWAVGNVDLLSDSAPRVMVTGARACTAYGEHITGELVAGMRRDVTLVTGLAYGVEGSAVRAALASGRPLIVVSASGLDRPYPLGHADMHRRVIDAGGVVISSAPIGAVPTRHRFLERGRIAAALSDAVIITEAGPRSGALHTAATAHDLGIPRGAVPGPITSVIYGLSSARALFLRDLPVNDVKDSSPRSVLRSIRRASKASRRRTYEFVNRTPWREPFFVRRS